MANYLIRAADINDVAIISKYDKHIPKNRIADKVSRSEIYVVYDGANFAGWLRYGLFWDIVPFMNMLEILPDYRGRGMGRQLVEFWESQMKEHGHKMVMTSTQQNEQAQHFYNALGYSAMGGFVQSFEAVTGESFEIILAKNLMAVKNDLN